MKRLIFAVAAAALTLGAAGAGLAQSVTLTLAHQYPATQPLGDGYNLWAKRVGELSGGDIEVKVFPGSTLIPSNEAFAAVSTGSVDASNMIGGFQVGDIPELAVMGLPFMFDDYGHYRRTVDNGLFDIIAGLYEAQGIKLLNLFPKGWVQVYHKEKFLLAPEDFEGATLRGVGGAASAALIALGVNEVRLPTTEVTAGLQRGVVNGIITNCVAHIGRSWYEQTPYASLVSFANDGEGLGINLDRWNGLTPEQQEILAKAAKEMDDFEWDLQARVEGKDCFDDWNRLGVHVKEATPVQRAALRAAMTPVYEQYSKELPILADVQKLVDANR